MGMKSKLMGMTKEYMKNPEAQYFKYLDKILNMSLKNGVGKEKVLKHVKEWSKR